MSTVLSRPFILPRRSSTKCPLKMNNDAPHTTQKARSATVPPRHRFDHRSPAQSSGGGGAPLESRGGNAAVAARGWSQGGDDWRRTGHRCRRWVQRCCSMIRMISQRRTQHQAMYRHITTRNLSFLLILMTCCCLGCPAVPPVKDQHASQHASRRGAAKVCIFQ